MTVDDSITLVQSLFRLRSEANSPMQCSADICRNVLSKLDSPSSSVSVLRVRWIAATGEARGSRLPLENRPTVPVRPICSTQMHSRVTAVAAISKTIKICSSDLLRGPLRHYTLLSDVSFSTTYWPWFGWLFGDPSQFWANQQRTRVCNSIAHVHYVTSLAGFTYINPSKDRDVNWLHMAIQVQPTFLISDIRALWRLALSARVPECQKSKM